MTPSHIRKLLKASLFTAIFLLSLLPNSFALPLNNYFDSQPIYNVFGTDKFYKERDKAELRLCLTPFYQSASTARDNCGIKVPAGDRLGQWNAFAIFYGQEAAPKIINAVNYPNYFAARNAVRTRTEMELTMPTLLANADRYRVGTLPPAIPGGLIAERNFNPDRHTFAYFTVPIKYEKIGLRSQLSFDLGCGIGATVKGGIVDVKQKPRKFVFERQFLIDIGFVIPDSGATPPEVINPDPAPADAVSLYENLLSFVNLDRIADELDFSFCPFHTTKAEDTHVQLYWHFPCEYKDKAGDIVATFIPYLALGVWIPTGEEFDQNKAFSVPTGNDGFTALTIDGSIAVDFPVYPNTGQTLQIAVGGGALISNERDLKDQRFPSSQLQTGFIPWKIAVLKKRPGLTWYLNFAGKAEEFLEGLSIYIDYTYTQHKRDKIMLKDPKIAINNAFAQGHEKATKESSWRNQQITAGMNYRLNRYLSLGAAAQGHISGTRVYRTVTILTSITATF